MVEEDGGGGGEEVVVLQGGGAEEGEEMREKVSRVEEIYFGSKLVGWPHDRRVKPTY
jgi:hypothetical protein